MKRLVVLIGILVMLTGCAAKQMTMQEQAEESRARAYGELPQDDERTVGEWIMDEGGGWFYILAP